ncbi:hypothetical protein YM304_13010 [Ilumatobacter coccineus YM16-304]|uniref:Uncharacterized protein n=1 Tax=Ilumatobacter coccineus (strain NBRC 103263 / KCTC 29153 / YM16-304) TaxID=1313172 RepID=A0A6C7E8Z4_ILUCY|nr:hypothetical protein YM304_13010 [Ilumatobacter coccineus YM16-304]
MWGVDWFLFRRAHGWFASRSGVGAGTKKPETKQPMPPQLADEATFRVGARSNDTGNRVSVNQCRQTDIARRATPWGSETGDVNRSR